MMMIISLSRMSFGQMKTALSATSSWQIQTLSPTPPSGPPFNELDDSQETSSQSNSAT